MSEKNESKCTHGWRGTNEAGVIKTRCPVCQGQLFVGQGGHLTCAVLECREPGMEQGIKLLINEAVVAEREAYEMRLAAFLVCPPSSYRFEHWCGDGWSYVTRTDAKELVRRIATAPPQEPTDE